jgi:hypothetical protein
MADKMTRPHLRQAHLEAAEKWEAEAKRASLNKVDTKSA